MDGRISLQVEKFFQVIAIAITIFAIGGMGPVFSLGQWRNPGLIMQYSHEFFNKIHQNVILGTELQKKLNQGIVLEFANKISTSFWSTMRFSLTGVIPTNIETQRTKTSISANEGISTVVFIPLITFDGKYVLEWRQFATQRKWNIIDLRTGYLAYNEKRNTAAWEHR